MNNIITFTGTLLTVVLILASCYWFTRKLGHISAPGRQSRYIKVLDYIVIGQERSLLIVQIGERYLLAGSSPEGLHLLTELRVEDLVEFDAPDGPAANFKDIIQQIRNQKKER